MRNKKYLTIILAAVFLVVLVVVVVPSIVSDQILESGDVEKFEESAGKYYLNIAGTVTQDTDESCTFTYTSDSTVFNIKEGELVCTVTGANVITRADELPEGSFVPGHNIIDVTDEEGNIRYYTHPYPPEEDDASRFDGDFILEDGSFMDGVYMVTVDILLENKDCSCWTLLDEGCSGDFYDPYLFGIQNLLKLYNLGESADSQNMDSNRIGFAFFSGYGECYDPEAPETQYDMFNPGNYSLAVRLEPGETKTITVGFLVTRRSYDGVLPDPGDLFVARLKEDTSFDKPAVYLGLDWPEKSV